VAGVAQWSVAANCSVYPALGAGPWAFHIRELAGPAGSTASGP